MLAALRPRTPIIAATGKLARRRHACAASGRDAGHHPRARRRTGWSGSSCERRLVTAGAVDRLHQRQPRSDPSRRELPERSASDMKAWAFIIDNSLLLVAGAVIGAGLGQCGPHIVRAVRARAGAFRGQRRRDGVLLRACGEGDRRGTLPGGALASPREAAVPVIAAAGGMAGPPLIYVALASALGRPELYAGLGGPVRDRHRVLVHGRPADLPRQPSGDSISAAAGDRRRCARPDPAGAVLSRRAGLDPHLRSADGPRDRLVGPG